MSDQGQGSVLVTGAAQRIGAGICRGLHAAGHDIALHYQSSAAAAAELCEALNRLRPDSCRLYRADLGQAAELASLCQRLQAEPLVGLVNNAAVYFPLEPAQETIENWDRVINTNLRAAWYLCRQLRPQLAQHDGSIVNIADANSNAHSRGFSIYELSKQALAELTRKLAVEFAPEVRVNAVAPGAILWPQQGPETDSHNQAAVLAGIPLGRLGEAQDIAGAVEFLLDRAPYVSGQILAVDGGRSLLS